MLFKSGNKYYFEVIHNVEIKKNQNNKEEIAENPISSLDTDTDSDSHKQIVEKVIATFVDRLFDNDGSERLLFENAEITVDDKSHMSLQYSVPTSFLTNVLDL